MDSINENIATVLAAIIALGLALRAGVGPVVMYLTEAVKDAFKPPAGWGGLISVLVGMILGITVGALAALTTPDTGIGTFMAFGAVAGLFMASGAIESHKAAGQVNQNASATVNVESADTVNAEPLAPGSYSYGYYPATLGAEPAGGYDGTYDINQELGSEPAESDDWIADREAGGHTGAAVEVAPLPDLGEPSDQYLGDGPPPGPPAESKTL